MSWDRFHYLCRKYEQSNLNGTDFSNTVNSIESQESTDLYGSPIESNSLANEILNTLKTSKDPSLVKNASSVYAKLNFSCCIEEPIRLKRTTTYLVLLTLIYLFLSTIYQIFVAPAFLSMFETLEVTPPQTFNWYINYSSYLSTIIIIFLILLIFITHQIKQLFMLKVSKSSSSLYNLLIPYTIKDCYISIIEIVTQPAYKCFSEKQTTLSKIGAHLQEVEDSGSNTIPEIENLLKIESRKLSDKAERFILIIMSLISIVIVTSIIIFIIGAYAPIFIMEDAL
ncbi:hypothetical protein [Candidatus Thiodiazotropha sp. CDECU1]|uniref:hypothetical protein n=1 Tax=Candidatus Thiodiazotropha sp. CDECU1 TaxID=3065865 RepID=UPI002930EE5B|nr:hypothetical protein [Candidatus Thiodiazotropha sp. CDECU1]